MFDDWGVWGSLISLTIIVMFINSTRKPQRMRMFNKKVDYVHVRTIKRF